MSEAIISAKNLHFKTDYFNSQNSSPFTFDIKAGEVGVIFNGKIASQIGRMIFGKGELLSGELNYHNSIEYSKENLFWRRNIGFGFREKGVLATQTVYGNVNLPVKYYYQSEELTKQALNDININESYWDLRPHLVSWQVRKKILIARAAVLNPKFIFLDDPVALLDIKAKGEFHHWLEIQKEKGSAILIGIDEIYSGLIWADWTLDNNNNQTYDFKNNFSVNYNQIAELLKEEFNQGT
jgi:ABC-type sugar transport system ATPase subunit